MGDAKGVRVGLAGCWLWDQHLSGTRFFELALQGRLGLHIAMHDADLGRHPRNSGHKPQQIRLPRVRRITAHLMNLRADVVALAIQHHPAAVRPVCQDVAARSPGGLVADEEDVVACFAEHGLEVVHHPAAGAHARAGDDHAGAAGAGEVVDRLQVVCVAVDDEQLVEGQRVAAPAQAGGGFFVPIALELTVEAGEFGRERRVDDDVELLPGGVVAGFADEVFDFVEQFLRAADGKRGDEHGAAIGQRVFEYGLEAVAAGGAVFVVAVAVGAFEDETVGALGRARVGQQGRIGSAEVAAEDDAFAALARAGGEGRGRGGIALDVGRPKDVARGLQTNGERARVILENLVPCSVGHLDDTGADLREHAFDEAGVARKADLERVFEYFGQHQRRRRRAQDRPVEAGREELRDAADVVDMNVGDYQRAEMRDGKVDGARVGPAAPGGFVSLKEAAVDEDAGFGPTRAVQGELVAGAGDAGDGAVVGERKHGGGQLANPVGCDMFASPFLAPCCFPSLLHSITPTPCAQPRREICRPLQRVPGQTCVQPVTR